jgi:hypothetical protein
MLKWQVALMYSPHNTHVGRACAASTLGVHPHELPAMPAVPATAKPIGRQHIRLGCITITHHPCLNNLGAATIPAQHSAGLTCTDGMAWHNPAFLGAGSSGKLHGIKSPLRIVPGKLAPHSDYFL